MAGAVVSIAVSVEPSFNIAIKIQACTSLAPWPLREPSMLMCWLCCQAALTPSEGWQMKSSAGPAAISHRSAVGAGIQLDLKVKEPFTEGEGSTNSMAASVPKGNARQPAKNHHDGNNSSNNGHKHSNRRDGSNRNNLIRLLCNFMSYPGELLCCFHG